MATSTGTPEVVARPRGAGGRPICSRSARCAAVSAGGRRRTRRGRRILGARDPGGRVLGPLAEWAEHVALSGTWSSISADHGRCPPVAPRPAAWLLAPVPRAPSSGGSAGGSTRPALRPSRLPPLNQIVWHVPAAFDTALRVERFHELEHVSFLASGLLLWWPVAGPGAPVAPAEPASPAPLSLPRNDPDDGDRRPDHARRGLLYPYYAAAGPRGRSGRGRTRSSRRPHVGGRDARLPGRGHRGVLPVGRARDPRRRAGAPRRGGGDGPWR